MREAVLLYDQSQFPSGDAVGPTSGTAVAPSGANHCFFLFLLKDFQTMTWPALWMVATAQTRRRVSVDLCSVVFFSSHSSGLPPAPGKSPVPSTAHLHGEGKRGLSHGAKGKFLASVVTPGVSTWRGLALIPWRLCSSSCHQGRRDLCLPVTSRALWCHEWVHAFVCLPPHNHQCLEQGGNPATIR